jgi:preprotein translocase subunit SecG
VFVVVVSVALLVVLLLLQQQQGMGPVCVAQTAVVYYWKW